jgi:ABC-type multidrug transport system fused ATPase/permease subunit
MGVASFIAGFIFSFYWGWVFTLILLGAFPFLAAMGTMMGVAMQGGFAEQMRAYSQSAGYAE